MAARHMMRALIWMCLLGAACVPPVAAEDAAPAQLRLEVEVVERAVPPETANVPLVVLLHGRGHHPEGILPALSGLPGPVKIVAPRAPQPWGDGASWFDHSSGSGKLSSDHVRARASLVAEVIAAHRVGEGPVLVTGFSQGGILSFAMAVHHPELVDAVFPVAGVWLDHGMGPASASQAATPIRAFHGVNDRVIPLSATRRGVEALASAGFDVSLKTYAGLDHAISAEERRDWYRALISAMRARVSP